MVKKMLVRLIITLFALAVTSSLNAEELVTKEQIKGLDEQVQEIKKEVLAISAELNQLEEKLLYPSNTQLAIFVSMEKNSKTPPIALKIMLDEDDISHHIYSFKEIEALNIGGVQRIYTGNIRTGEHNLKINVINKQSGGNNAHTVSHQFDKGIKPQMVEIRLSDSGVTFRNW